MIPFLKADDFIIQNILAIPLVLNEPQNFTKKNFHQIFQLLRKNKIDQNTSLRFERRFLNK